MKVLFRIIFIIFFISSIGDDGYIFGQDKQTYKLNGTTYYYGESYSTTGKPKVERSSSAKSEFLKNKGYDKVPNGYQVDHIVPLSEGGLDKPYNMQLITIEQHKRKTASERASNSINSTYQVPSYNSSSTYKNLNNYSTPSYSTGSGRTIHTGPRGGQYYINSNGNKTYVKKK
jgi:hypothetical protein